MAVKDLDQNGKPEIIGAVGVEPYNLNEDESYWVTLEWDGERYEPVHVSNPVENGNVLVVGQADGDAEFEVFLGTATHLHIYEARDRLPRTSFPIPNVNAIAPGDVDADGALEVVVVSNSSLGVYDLTTGDLEQSLPYGFMDLLAVGQADADPALEIAVGAGLAANVVDGLTGLTEAGAPDLRYKRHLLWIDLDADGVDELVFAEDEVLTAWSLEDAGQVWQVSFPVTGGLAGRVYGVEAGQADSDADLELVVALPNDVVYLELDGQPVASPTVAIAGEGRGPAFVGDFDGDSDSEVVRLVDRPASAGGLTVQDLRTGESEYRSPSFLQTPVFDAGDLNGDGVADLIIGGSGSLLQGPYTTQAEVLIYDGTSRRLLCKELLGGPSTGFPQVADVAILELDDDLQKEVCFTVNDSTLPGNSLLCYDSVSWLEDLRFEDAAFFDQILQRDLDGDGEKELLLSSGRVVYAIDPRSGFLEWRSPQVAPQSLGRILSIEGADFDGDQVEEVLVGLSDGQFAVLDGATGFLEAGPANLDSASVLTLDLGSDGLPELVLGTLSGAVVQVDPMTLATNALAALSTDSIDSLELYQQGSATYVAVATSDEVRLYADLTGPPVASIPLGLEPGRGDSMSITSRGGADLLWVATSTGVFALGSPGVVFVDGFESGGFEAWSGPLP